MKPKHRNFLNELVACGMRSNFAAESYLKRRFALTTHEARNIVLEWLEARQ